MTPPDFGASDVRPDAELVQDFLTGNSAALGVLYDRFAPGLYDTAAAMLRDRDGAGDVVQDVFVVAATKLRQLRDPSRVKPWLYAIARHEIFRRTKQRSRSTPFSALGLDALGDEFGMDPMAEPDPHAEGAVAESQELASLVRDAAFGLDPTDQLLLELSARQGLVGAELAAAIGVPVAKAHSMMFRMRERLERAVGAVVVTRGGRRRCDDLATVLTGWDGRFDVLWRKRISRHIEDCATCQETRRGAAVLSLAGFAPAFALPGMLRDRTLSKALGAGLGGPGGPAGHGGPGPDVATNRYRFDGDGFPVFGHRRPAFGRGGERMAARSISVAVAGTLAAALVIVLGMVTLYPPTIEGSVSDDAVSPVALAVESTSPDTTLEATTTSTPTSSSTPTSTTAPTTTIPVVAPPTVPPTAATPPSVFVTTPPTFGTTALLGPTTSMTRPTTTTATTATTTTRPTSTTIALAPSPPQIRQFAVTPNVLTSCGDLSPDAAASVYDRDADISSVVVTWSGRQNGGSNQLSGSGTLYTGQIGPFPQTAGPTYTVTAVVTDSTGLTASSSTSVGVGPC